MTFEHEFKRLVKQAVLEALTEVAQGLVKVEAPAPYTCAECGGPAWKDPATGGLVRACAHDQSGVIAQLSAHAQGSAAMRAR